MTKPNPGSKEAQDQGCLCPVIDNHYGNGFPDGNGGVNFWYSGDCPLHTPKATQSKKGKL
jgi:hypothetical protein